MNLGKIDTPFGLIRGYVIRNRFIPVDADLEKWGMLTQAEEAVVFSEWVYIALGDDSIMPILLQDI